MCKYSSAKSYKSKCIFRTIENAQPLFLVRYVIGHGSREKQMLYLTT